MLSIRRFRDKILFQNASEVTEDEFGEDLDSFMSEMATTMYGARGVGLAGPQVGDLRRILVADLGYVVGSDYGSEVIKMVNPIIASSSVEEARAEEGCLSYPELAIKVTRPIAVHVKFFTPLGEPDSRTFNDWQARIVLHEMDHLDGITLYSRSSQIKKRQYDRKIDKARRNR